VTTVVGYVVDNTQSSAVIPMLSYLFQRNFLLWLAVSFHLHTESLHMNMKPRTI